MSRRAGMVKITPAARASPEDAAVCTMWFSRMFDSRKRRSTAIEIPAAAIQDDLGALVRDHGLNVTLEDPAPQMHGSLGMIGDPFVVLTDVDELEPLAAVQLGLHLGDRAFLDVLLRLFDQFQKPRIMLHGSPRFDG